MSEAPRAAAGAPSRHRGLVALRRARARRDWLQQQIVNTNATISRLEEGPADEAGRSVDDIMLRTQRLQQRLLRTSSSLAQIVALRERISASRPVVEAVFAGAPTARQRALAEAVDARDRRAEEALRLHTAVDAAAARFREAKDMTRRLRTEARGLWAELEATAGRKVVKRPDRPSAGVLRHVRRLCGSA